MIPSVLAHQVRLGVEDFLRTTFPVSSPFFAEMLERLLRTDGSVFRGPYLSIQLPFLQEKRDGEHFPDVPLGFAPYLHQELAFARLRGPSPRSTIVATGTGSGKTECFLWPILDHCYRHRNEPGVKAIIVYPMNALASDQAGRLARVIWQSPKLRGKVTAGLFVGQSDATSTHVLTETGIITSRQTQRLSPPHILLTNYKMLDYLLVRPRDFPLWAQNGPETLRYLVVDELHTFDGAQGTDLACLVRRLKARLRAPKEQLCCVGTSATLGEGSEPGKLLAYASQIFGEPFDVGSVVTEQRQSAGKFLESALIARLVLPARDRAERLDPASYERHSDYVRAQHELWLGTALSEAQYAEPGWRLALPEALKGHLFFQNVLEALGGRPTSYADLLRRLEKVTPELRSADRQYGEKLLDSLLALVSEARVPAVRAAGAERLEPFLHVRVQLWLRELRRMVAEVAAKPTLRFADDLTDEQLDAHLPVVHCRECGAMGWAGTKRQGEGKIRGDLQAFYVAFFTHSPNVIFLFPEPDGQRTDSLEALPRKLCLDCRRLAASPEAKVCPSCGHPDLVLVQIPDSREKRNGRFVGLHDCPYCRGSNCLTILGSRAASLTSVLVAQLFSSPFNDDKKLLTFSDSVQDAAHRAGFFAARTFRFTLRAALQQLLMTEGEGQRLSDLPERFCAYWRARLGSDLAFVSTFLAPDMAWMEEHDRMRKLGKVDAGGAFLHDIQSRLGWEIHAECGYNSRIGRTLEKTSCSVAHVDPGLLDQAVARLLEPLRNEIGPLRELDGHALRTLLLGLVTHLRTEGAVLHPVLDGYVQQEGNIFVLNHVHWMPNTGEYARAPVFLATRRDRRLEPVLGPSGTTPTWCARWADKSLDRPGLALAGETQRIYDLVLRTLTELGVLERRQSHKGASIWGLSPRALRVSLGVRQLRCARCGHNASVPVVEEPWWQDAPCLRFHCPGRYAAVPAPGRDYYGRLYAHGDVERVFTAEHSGLLAREEREAIEAEFKTRSTERRPWYPNLLSCTPTLELGVDIGDLSSLILCSVPPAQASYVQRVGRAGRRDGNSLALSVANARPHDLYFFADPEQMIAGRIEAPGVFLEASAVLERQLTAYCFDRWVETGVDERAVPARVGAVLRQLEPEDPSRFPHSLLQHVEAHRTELLERFVADFGLDGASAAAAGCRRFMEGDAKAEGSLPFRILSRLHELNKQRKTLAGNIKLLGERIRRRRDQVARDRSLEAELEELEQERAALQRLVASIMDRDTFNFFTDEGLLPNYAFPEAGVVLRSVIYRRRTNQPSGKRQYDTWAYEYQRAASSAIAELAPANHFFAGKRKVEIDQVDMALSDIETWRLCPSCSHAERLGEQEEQATCPRCGETSWADSGQKCQMLRMRQVFATSSDRRSFIGDDADDREPKFYDRQMLVEVDPANISKAYRLDCEDLPFGFELLSRATFREVNFGEKGDQGSLMGVAGVSQPRRGFEICRHCGKVQEPNKPARHAHTCTARAPGADQNFTRCVYLYRELCSEAIRILLPVAAFAESDRKLHSFVAALHLGLKQRFGGSIDHLQTAVQDEPDPGTGHRKRYLVLCDTVPGGTGYLKQLMLSGGEPIEVFDRALGVLTRCSCNQDPARDGCYRCLYAYRHSYDMKETSRNAAVELFSAVVERRAKLVEAPDLRGISVNALFDSVLEAKFVEALGRCGREDRPVVMRREIVSGKPGYFFKIGERSYYIEPQVELGPGDGVAAASRADFVIRPATTRAGALPIAVFTDGLAHHKDRVGKDTAQRLAIVRSRKLLVWSLTWKDVDRELRSQADHFANYLDPADKPSPAVFAQLAHGFGAEGLRDANGESSFAWLVRLLAHPEPESCLRAWRAYAFVHALMLTDIQAFAAAAAAESWRKRLDEAFGGDLGAELTAAEPSLLGLYEREGPKKARLVRAFASVEQAAVQEQTFDAMRIGVYLHDTPEARERADFEAIWTGFLRLGNLFQFLPRFVFVTASGLEADAYGLLPPAPPLLAPPGPEPDPWDDIRDTTDPRLHPLLARLAERRWPLPADPPLELVDESGETIAEAELGWPELRLAVLDGPQLVRASRFEARGWRVFAADDVVDRPELLLEAHQPGDKP